MIKYKLKAIFGMKYKNFFKTIDYVHEKTGKSKTSIFFDILNCAIKYGAGHNDYRTFEFYNMTEGKKYDYLGVIGIVFGNNDMPNRYFCSEWCAEVLGIPNSSKITPAKLYRLYKNKVKNENCKEL